MNEDKTTAAGARSKAGKVNIDQFDGPELFALGCHGTSIPDMKLKALDRARAFYGAGAELRVVDMSNISGDDEDGGGLFAQVFVLCLNLPGEDRYPVSLKEIRQ